MKTSVIIPSKNGLHHLKECLPSVINAAQKAPFETEIIVIDDNSNDNTFEILPQIYSKIKVLKNPKQGACSARNFAVKNSSGNWLLFIDNDVFLEEDFFFKTTKYLQDDIFCVACCGYLAAEPNKQIDGIKLISWKRGYPRFTGNIYNENLKAGRIYQSFGVQGAYFFCKRSNFIVLNGFDEDLFDPYLLEETDLMYRGLKRGWKIIYAPDTYPLHKCGGTIQSKVNHKTKFLSTRNRIIFVWKNITSKRLLFLHFIWLILRPNFKVLKEVFKMRHIIKIKRSIEKANAIMTDEEIFKQNYKLIKEIKNEK